MYLQKRCKSCGQKIRIVKNLTGKKYHSYIHVWLRRIYGRATKCSNPKCLKKSKTYDYSLIHGQKHGKDITRYRQLCRSCHFKYDMTEEKRNHLSKIAKTKN